MSLNNKSNDHVIYKHNDNIVSIHEKENKKLNIERKHMIEYDTILGDMEINYNEYKEKSDDLYVKYYGKQINNIRMLAKKLEDSGHVLEKICAKVSRDVEKYEIDSRRVREALDDKYKQSKHNKTLLSKRGESASYMVVTNQARNESNSELEKIVDKDHEPKKAILLANNGSVINESESSNNNKETIDFSELKKQVVREISDDREEQLGYSMTTYSITPNNNYKIPSNKKDSLIANLEEQLRQIKEDWQFEVERNRKLLSQKIKAPDPLLQQKNEALKRQVQNLKAQLENCHQKSRQVKSQATTTKEVDN
jgi:hypothetical protein